MSDEVHLVEFSRAEVVHEEATILRARSRSRSPSIQGFAIRFLFHLCDAVDVLPDDPPQRRADDKER